MRSLVLFWLSGALLVLQAQQNRVDLWKQDIASLLQTIRQTHPRPTANVSAGQLELATLELADQIGQLPDYGVVLELTRITARLGDSSTLITPFQAGLLRTFPIRIYRFQDGWYVTDASERHLRLLGRKVTKIADTSIDDALARVKPYIAAENDNWLYANAQTYLISPEVLYAVGIIPDRTAPAIYEVEDGSGGVISSPVAVEGGTLFSLSRSTRPNQPLAWRNRGLYYWYDYLEADRTLYIKYDICVQDPTMPMRDFVREVIDFAATKSPTKLVIDLRDNFVGDPLVSEVFLLSLQQAQNSGGLPKDTYAIVSRTTSGPGTLAAFDLKKAGAKLVGEVTGGRPHHFGDPRVSVLPNSRLLVQVSTKEYLPQESGDLTPDVLVTTTPLDVRAQRDPYLETILKQ